ncbi:DUF1638 domain-containing protein [Methanolobus zinderi]|jgi:hypothetical protein|uniref:DUF1638 domain-containing protein n=1 Tax=Methanolobus zinderi TaxID=536044 RepID=A0A7D5I4Y7_9EURY|nr:DUF1638 domain-containing protein [Methanolobus zinderi]QLC49861.1 DUF1638 domain-containing protein [Methanolobus zinderi]
MPVLSLIGCKILEDEITHVLSRYNENTRVILIDDRESIDLARKLKSQDTPFSLAPIDRIRDFITSSEPGPVKKKFMSLLGKKYKDEMIVIIKIMPLGLHVDSNKLREIVAGQINLMSEFSDGVLLFYGLCGNALKDIGNSEDISVPLYVLKDKNGEHVDDCISIALGGNRRYEEELERYNDTATLYFTPLWASSWKDMKDIPADAEKISEYRYSFRIGRVARLDTGLEFEKDFDSRIKELARKFNAEVVELKGNTDIVENCYLKVRKNLTEQTGTSE